MNEIISVILAFNRHLYIYKEEESKSNVCLKMNFDLLFIHRLSSAIYVFIHGDDKYIQLDHTITANPATSTATSLPLSVSSTGLRGSIRMVCRSLFNHTIRPIIPTFWDYLQQFW